MCTGVCVVLVWCLCGVCVVLMWCPSSNLRSVVGTVYVSAPLAVIKLSSHLRLLLSGCYIGTVRELHNHHTRIMGIVICAGFKITSKIVNHI